MSATDARTDLRMARDRLTEALNIVRSADERWQLQIALAQTVRALARVDNAITIRETPLAKQPNVPALDLLGS